MLLVWNMEQPMILVEITCDPSSILLVANSSGRETPNGGTVDLVQNEQLDNGKN